MQKDINLLGSLNESQKKGSSSSMGIVLVLGVLLIIGVLVFLYVSTSNEVKEKQAILDQINKDMGIQNQIPIINSKNEKEKAQFEKVMAEVLMAQNTGRPPIQSYKISSKFLEVIYTNYIFGTSPGLNGKMEPIQTIMIGTINVSGSNITMDCTAKSYEEAWTFIHYLMGTLEVSAPEGAPVVPPKPVKPTPPGAGSPEGAEAQYEQDMQKYEADMKAYNEAMQGVNDHLHKQKLYEMYTNHPEMITNNAKYFTGVLEGYMGLPPEGDKTDYKVGFSLNFQINWGEMAL